MLFEKIAFHQSYIEICTTAVVASLMCWIVAKDFTCLYFTLQFTVNAKFNRVNLNWFRQYCADEMLYIIASHFKMKSTKFSLISLTLFLCCVGEINENFVVALFFTQNLLCNKVIFLARYFFAFSSPHNILLETPKKIVNVW